MHTLRNLALLLAAGTVAAQAPATPTDAPTPRFSDSDIVPENPGYEDAFSLVEVKLGGKPVTGEEQLTRWLDELKAGRARAGSLAGSQIAYVAVTRSDCVAARDALLKADELGHERAARALADLATNITCGEIDYAEVERWLRKAVTLDYLPAAQRLIVLHAPDGRRPDPLQRYVYARAAAKYWDAISPSQPKPTGETGFDAEALQAIENDVPAADRKRAEDEAAKIASAMLKRRERFKPVQSQEFTRGGRDAKSGKGYGFVAYTNDYHHECAWNLAGNCRGAQRLAFVDVNNNEQDFMSCKAELRAKDFVTGEPAVLTREVLIGPQVTRRLVLGDVYVVPDKSAMSVNCKAVPKLAENAAAGKCRARLKNQIDAQQFYPTDARQRGIEGSVVVRYWVPPGSEEVVDAEIAKSSGHPSLDAAALNTISSGRFANECDYGLSSIRISFKLQE